MAGGGDVSAVVGTHPNVPKPAVPVEPPKPREKKLLFTLIKETGEAKPEASASKPAPSQSAAADASSAPLPNKSAPAPAPASSPTPKETVKSEDPKASATPKPPRDVRTNVAIAMEHNQMQLGQVKRF